MVKPVFSFRYVAGLVGIAAIFSSCSIQKKIARSARENVLQSTALKTAHVGISVYEPATGKYWYDYQGDKYFVPASNTKIPTCFAAMKYLGDSLEGLRWAEQGGSVLIQGTGDPTFLHPEFVHQPVFEKLKQLGRKADIYIATDNWKDRHWGMGWSWSDYDATYMAERSPMPVYGNVVKFFREGNEVIAIPALFSSAFQIEPGAQPDSMTIQRDLAGNIFRGVKRNNLFNEEQFPFVTEGYSTSALLLNDTLHSRVSLTDRPEYRLFPVVYNSIKSQPTDSMLKPMMHRSDNFYAEQSLLMVSNQLLGYQRASAIIDTLFKTDFADLPQKPRWVDGSGLSRYNLFTPQSLVAILGKMQQQFGMERIKQIFPTGGTGTISSYYQSDSGYIYAKTGTLSGVVALSGFVITRRNKMLIFSVLVNNHQASATDVRKAVEKFLTGIRAEF